MQMLALTLELAAKYLILLSFCCYLSYTHHRHMIITAGKNRNQTQ